MSYVVEPMQLGDIDEVIEIEKDAFTIAWSAASYRRELEENRMARYIVLRDLPEDPAVDLGLPQQHGEQERPARADFRRLAESLRGLLFPPRTPGVKRGRILGYAGMWLVVDEAHLTTIAVSAGHRGRGLGELLLVRALELAKRADARVMTLEVRVSNTVAQKLYRKYGFEVAGLRRRYYTDNNEDALIMTSEELSSPDFTARFEALKEANTRRIGVSPL